MLQTEQNQACKVCCGPLVIVWKCNGMALASVRKLVYELQDSEDLKRSIAEDRHDQRRI